jgi:hypothetical protein
MGEDVQLTFDPSSFINGIKKITEAMNGFEKNTRSKGEQVNKTTGGMSSFMVAKGMIMANLLMGAFSKVFNFIKQGLPEIGKTFSIASGVIQRNLLWPLRKELAPILQSILNWTRDHRAMFVRWGGTLVNIFRAVSAIAKGFYSMFRAMFEPIAKKLKEVFGGVAGGISDVFNVLLFRVTVVIMYLQAALMPLMKSIGDSIAWWVDGIRNFFDGFMNGVSGISGPFEDILNQFYELLNVLGLSSEQTSALYSVFKVLGDFMGTVLYTAIAGIAELLDGIVSGIKALSAGISWAKAKLTSDQSAAHQAKKEMDQIDKDFTERSKRRAENVNRKWGEFGGRTVAEFSPSSKTSSKQVNASSTVRIEKMEIRIDPSMDTKKTAETFVEGMNKRNSQNMKKILMDEATTMGY